MNLENPYFSKYNFFFVFLKSFEIQSKRSLKFTTTPKISRNDLPYMQVP